MTTTNSQPRPREASDLAPLDDPLSGAQAGQPPTFATVLAGLPADESLAVLSAGAEPPSASRLRRVPTRARKAARHTADAAAIARHNGSLYLIGSQFGGPHGPLEPGRGWIARVDVEDVERWLADPSGKAPKLQLLRARFALHRAVNDALARAAVRLATPGTETARRYVDQTLRRGVAKNKRWRDQVRAGDAPVCVGGAEVRANGTLLLGLRYPVSDDGAPLLVELEDPEAMLAGTEPHCSAVWWLEGVGSPERPVGIRALGGAGPDRFEAIVGGLDAGDEGATIVADDPRAADGPSTHVAFDLPAVARGGAVLARPVHRLAGGTRADGVASADGDFLYLTGTEDGPQLDRLRASDARP